MTRKRSLAALALACVCSPALAVEAVALTVQPVAGPAVTLPYGEAIVAIVDLLREILLPVLVAVVTGVFARLGTLGPILRMFITDRLIEDTIRKWLDYAINDLEGAVKDKALTIPVGSVLIARPLQRGVKRADASAVCKWVVARAVGPAEVAHKMLRMLHLEADAVAAKVPPPVLDRLPSSRR